MGCRVGGVVGGDMGDASDAGGWVQAGFSDGCALCACWSGYALWVSYKAVLWSKDVVVLEVSGLRVE